MLGLVSKGCLRSTTEIAITLSLSTDSMNFSNMGGEQSFSIETNTISWNISSDASWLTVSPSSGSGNRDVTVTTTAHAALTQRTATISVTGSDVQKQTIAVTQAERSLWFNEMDMVFVQDGTFTMGCTDEQDNDCFYWEKPAHQVTMSSYYIGKYEVTEGQWKVVMGSNPSVNVKGDNYPVESVYWNDIVGTSGSNMVINGITYYSNGFIYKLNELTRKRYRLPTEAEWEYAARGGNKNKGYMYSGSNTLWDVAWYWVNSNKCKYTVGTKSPNELGIYDMSGNVWEWCSDRYSDYSSDAQTNPQGPSSGADRVYRGGGWSSNASNCRVSSRSKSVPNFTCVDLGLRLALSL